MKLIVCLGNPGKEYINTRHNIGFDLIDYILKDDNNFINKFDSLYKELEIEGEKVIIIKPLTFMNLSGISVKKVVDFYKIDINNMLVIQDDLDMSLGKIKFVYNSSSGGHNGIKNIEENIGSKQYLRLKIGISNDKNIFTRDYVLSKFSEEEENVLNNSFKKLSNLLIDFVICNKEELMSKYNNK